MKPYTKIPLTIGCKHTPEKQSN